MEEKHIQSTQVSASTTDRHIDMQHMQSFIFKQKIHYEHQYKFFPVHLL